jgi:hypothetical protein
MALTYAAQSTEGDAASVNTMVTTLLGSGTGLFVAGYVDGRGVGHSFMPSVINQATAGDAVSKWFPQVAQSTAVGSSSGTLHDGPIKLVLTAEAADTVNGSSVQTVVLDRFATVITVTGTI